MATHILDEIAEAPRDAVGALGGDIARSITAEIGAIVEYELQRRHNRPELPRLSQRVDSGMAARVESLAAGTVGPRLLSLQPVDQDVTSIPPLLSHDTSWTAFVKRAEVTARSVGIADHVAAAIAGAMLELADNVIQHSEAPASGIAAFARARGYFEYVVADAGIGMLRSLRRAPEFQSLRDDLEALPLAITPGVSRRGRGSGYGYGYRQVFAPLRAASGSIRLRSGQAVLHVTGLGATPDQAQCSQRREHHGVVVAAVIHPTRAMPPT